MFEQTFKNIDGVLRKEAGMCLACTSPLMTWEKAQRHPSAYEGRPYTG
jgi:hypothetical protein